MVVIQLIGLAVGPMLNQIPTPFDGKYLKEYDPSKDGVDADGRAMVAHIITTPDIDEALQFPSHTEAWECWKQVDPRKPMRADGRPNRPLTAFTVQILTIGEKE